MSCDSLGDKPGSSTALVIAHPYDHPLRVLHAVRVAGLSNRKVMLAQLSATPFSDMPQGILRRRRTSREKVQPRPVLGDAEWPNLWSEILNRVFLLGDVRSEDVPDLARAMGADHLVFCSQDVAEAFWKTTDRYDTAGLCDAPMWVMGRNVAPDMPEGIERILLPLSFRNDFEARLGAASQLAKATGAMLAILHVQSPEENPFEKACTTWGLSARLRDCLDRLLVGPCRIQISVCDGDPAEAILSFGRENPHGLILMRMSEVFRVDRTFRGVTRRVVNESYCPVVLMRSDLPESGAWMHSSAGETGVRIQMIARGPGGLQ
ncbi:MAG TPA: universal stress protein [Acidobacteriaceae bacterium]|nr:universal stress protein [Acidobacteriaceae bacterium]